MKVRALVLAFLVGVSVNAGANQVIAADIILDIGVEMDNGRPFMCAMTFAVTPLKRQGSTTGIMHSALTVAVPGIAIVSGKVGEADNREMSLKGKNAVWRSLALEDLWFQLPGGERTTPLKEKRYTEDTQHLYYVRFAKFREFTDSMQDGTKILIGYKDKNRKDGIVLSGRVTLEPAQFQKLSKCIDEMPQRSK